jgi:cupin 2 domain-containing protein
MQRPKLLNLLAELPGQLADEQFEQLLSGGAFRLERIVSQGQATPAGCWYDQPQDEWVLLLKGSAGLAFAGEEELITLGAGDSLLIPARQRHRVEWTDPQGHTVWLALHFAADSAPP